jgi:hypothetical protein
VHGFIINKAILITVAAISGGSGALPNASSEADASAFSSTQQSEISQSLINNTSSSTKIYNLDQNEFPVTDPLMILSQDMTSRSTADISVGDKQPNNFISFRACIIIPTGRSPATDVYLQPRDTANSGAGSNGREYGWGEWRNIPYQFPAHDFPDR